MIKISLSLRCVVLVMAAPPIMRAPTHPTEQEISTATRATTGTNGHRPIAVKINGMITISLLP
jgi:hypothetical protein